MMTVKEISITVLNSISPSVCVLSTQLSTFQTLVMILLIINSLAVSIFPRARAFGAYILVEVVTEISTLSYTPHN